MNYGFHPNFPFTIQELTTSSPVPAAEEVFKTLQQTTETARANLEKASQQQSLYANKKRTEINYSVGDKVYLSTENLTIRTGVSKLNPKYIGPFRIARIINSVAYQLDLPKNMNIQNVFHVSRLRTAKESGSFPDRPVLEKPPPAVIADSEKDSEWEIEKIIDKKRRRNRIEYLVRWRGYDSYENSWLPVSELKNARQAIADYEKSEFNSISTAANSSTQTTATTNAPGRVVESIQCTARIKQGKGRQCRNRTCRSGLCHIHLQRDQNLRIKPSSLPNAGFGLFTGPKQVKRSQTVTDYSGTVTQQPINGNYVLQCNKNHFINANSTKDTGGFANECRKTNRQTGQCQGNNSKFTWNPKTKTARIIATKSIPAQTEVFIPYGADYWSKFDKTKLKQN